jgi:pimeloyl-ACP methyl ester carboxylesterase
MATYALIHGAGDGGWFWHLVAAELRDRGQEELPTRFLLCRDDRFFPPEFLRRVVRERLGIVPDEIDGSHCVALSRPRELADRLEGYRAAL